MSADLLRRAADHLREPLLCNWHPDVASTLADLLDAHAVSFDAAREAETQVGLKPGGLTFKTETAAVGAARALLASWGILKEGGR